MNFSTIKTNVRQSNNSSPSENAHSKKDLVSLGDSKSKNTLNSLQNSPDRHLNAEKYRVTSPSRVP